MSYKLKNKQSGFTIIEVMIVLAIAGLIMLIVFLAVPALQRSSRNTARRNDATRIGTASTNFVSNNNGTLPSTQANAQSIVDDAGTLSQYPGFAAANPVGTAAANKLSIVAGAASNAAITVDGMQLVTGAKCVTTGGGGASSTGASARALALQYTQEKSDGTFQGVCVDV